MRIESLKMFCDLVKTGSFTKSSKLNGVTQSAVSQTITSMEEHFGGLLFERSKKLFRLTREGEVVYESSRQIVQTWNAAQKQMEALSRILSGTVELATTAGIGLYQLPPVLQQLQRDFPAITTHIKYCSPAQVYDEVASNVVDLGLVHSPTPHPKLVIVPFHTDPLRLICPPDHPLASRPTVTFEELFGQKIIVARECPAGPALIHQLRTSKGAMTEFDSVDTLKWAVIQHLGLAMLPENLVAGEVAAKTLVAVPFAEGNPVLTLAIVHKINKDLSLAMNQFLALLQPPTNISPVTDNTEG